MSEAGSDATSRTLAGVGAGEQRPLALRGTHGLALQREPSAVSRNSGPEFEQADAAGVMVGVAAAEVAPEGQCHLGVAGVVRGVEHELAQGSEVTLDAIEIAGSTLCASAQARICGVQCSERLSLTR